MDIHSALLFKQQLIHTIHSGDGAKTVLDVLLLFFIDAYILFIPQSLAHFLSSFFSLFHNPLGMIIAAFGLLLFITLLKQLFPFFIFLYQTKKLNSDEYLFLQVIFEHTNKETIFATEQLLHNLHNLLENINWKQKWLSRPYTISLELVASKHEGIRYILRVPKSIAPLIKSDVQSFLPGAKISDVSDYLHSDAVSSLHKKSFVLKLKRHTFLPMRKLEELPQHDPMAFITSHMTKLHAGEVISLSLILSPLSTNKALSYEKNKVLTRIRSGQAITQLIEKKQIPLVISLPFFVLKMIIGGIVKLLEGGMEMIKAFDHDTYLTSRNTIIMQSAIPIAQMLPSYEQELHQLVKGKLEKPLFVATIRSDFQLLDEQEIQQRFKGMMSSLGSLGTHRQSFVQKREGLIFQLISKHNYIKDYVSLVTSHRFHAMQNKSVLTISEVAALYHFPHASATETEDIVKVYSRELPLPLSQKQKQDYDLVIGKNTYGGYEGYIKLTAEDRERHVLTIGGTGTGKSTMLLYSAIQDIQKGRGLAVVDPHGEFAESALQSVPLERKDDVVYFNPIDLDRAMVVNLLELPECKTDAELELAQEQICEMVVSIFRKIFQKEKVVNASRIEALLRNSVYTAYTVKDVTIFTIFDLLTNKEFRDSVVSKLENEKLANFWKEEFGSAGDYQRVKIMAGVTTKIERFLFSPTARRIFGQPKSTIDFEQIMDQEKILICNLSKGNIGEDNTDVLGTMILAKIQLAALRRHRIKAVNRVPFYLYVDEFQTFATRSFIEMLSEARKYKLYLFLAEQSTAQQYDRSLINIIFANVATVIGFRTANLEDERLLLAQFAPYIKPGELINLPKYRFYCKLSAVTPEEPFSGITIVSEIPEDAEKLAVLINASRQNYTVAYTPPKVQKVSETEIKTTPEKPKPTKKKPKKQGEIDGILT